GRMNRHTTREMQGTCPAPTGRQGRSRNEESGKGTNPSPLRKNRESGKPGKRKETKARRRVASAGCRPPLAIAIAAVDRLAVRGIERPLRGLSARIARDVVQRPGAAAVAEAAALALVAADLAALGLVGEPLLGVELLFVRRENEGGATVDAV